MDMNTSGQKGDRVRVLRWGIDINGQVVQTVPVGSVGEITLVDDLGTRHVRWENGHSLGLLPDQDQWEVL